MNPTKQLEQETSNIQTLSLWHGGRDLEHDYRTPKASSKGRWEHGPGLYLTTHYETARKYAKGGGKTYRVEFELGNNIKDIFLPLDDTLNFIKNYVTKSKQKDVLEDIHRNMKRMNLVDKVEAQVLVNLMINHEALIGEKTVKLNRFLVNNGVDYGSSDRFSGRDETIFIIYNLDKIKKVKAIASKDVNLNDWELSISLASTNKLKI